MPTTTEIATSAELARRMVCIRQHGSRTTSYSSLQPGVEAFFPNETGFLAFERFARSPTTLWGRVPMTFALADPVAATNEQFHLIDDFLAEHRRVCFLQVSAPIAQYLSHLGHLVGRIGVEIHLELASFSLNTSTRRNLRQTVNHARRAGVSVVEQLAHDIDADEVTQVSRLWMRTKRCSRRELRFLTRPPRIDDECDVRKFYAFDGRHLLGYVHFDPLYERGDVIGYTANIVRARPDAPGGTLDLIKTTAIEQFRAEGKRVLSLGFSPLATVDQRDPLTNSAAARFWSRLFARRLQGLYSFSGLYFHKHRYAGIEEPVYGTTNSRVVALNGLRILQLVGVV